MNLRDHLIATGAIVPRPAGDPSPEPRRDERYLAMDEAGRAVAARDIARRTGDERLLQSAYALDWVQTARARDEAQRHA